MGNLEGEIAIVTSAARGAAAAIARRFFAAGARGVLGDVRHPEHASVPRPGSASEEPRARGTPPELARIERLLGCTKALRRAPLPNGP
jgi:NAD(P)-dependent dehydrogenase (short-subunit alcohol dehydrogenase family)